MSNTVTPQTGSGTQGPAGTAAEQAGEVAGSARQQASEVVGAAKDEARTVVEDARHQARQLLDDSRQQVRDQAGEQTKRAASSIRDVGQQIRRMAEGEGRPDGPVGDLARQAADGALRLADRLEQRSPEDLLEEVRSFARRRPGLFLLGALGAGFAAGRLLRAADTSSLTETAKEAMGMGGEHGSGEGTYGRPTAAEGISGPGAVAAGTAGTSPPGPQQAHPPRSEPLRAETGYSTGWEA